MSDDDSPITEEELADLEPELRAVIEERIAFYAELEGQSPRAAVILAVASLEDQIMALIRTKFPEDVDEELWRAIAGSGHSPLGSMKAKADFAQAFGFFGQKTRKTIDRIASMRNRFAHRTGVRDFDHPDIVKRCKAMEANPIFPQKILSGASAADLRWFFTQVVRALEERLEDIRWHIPEIDVKGPDPLP